MGLRRIDYQHGKDKVFAEAALEGGEVITFEATAVRRTYSGISARVDVLQDGVSVGYDSFNVEKHKDRVTLTNACYDRLGKSCQEQYGKVLFRYDFDQFCAGLWDAWVEQYASEEVAGDPTLGPTTYLLEPYVLEKGGTILYAPPGRGKSTLALLWAQSINAGVSHFWPSRMMPVLFINLERPRDSIKRRLVHINQQLGLPPETQLRMMNARGRSLSDIIDIAKVEVERHGIRFGVLDSLTRAGFGDLNENEPANRAMDALNGLFDSWLAIAHTPKDKDGSIFGSQMFGAAADLTLKTLSQVKDDGTLGVGIEGDKANDVPRPRLTIWALEFDTHGLSCFRKARDGEFSEIESRRQMGMKEQVVAYLRDHGPSDATTIHKDTGLNRQNLSAMFNSDREFTKAGKAGRSQLFAVHAREYDTEATRGAS